VRDTIPSLHLPTVYFYSGYVLNVLVYTIFKVLVVRNKQTAFSSIKVRAQVQLEGERVGPGPRSPRFCLSTAPSPFLWAPGLTHIVYYNIFVCVPLSPRNGVKEEDINLKNYPFASKKK
jgi:hypothetical protein